MDQVSMSRFFTDYFPLNTEPDRMQIDGVLPPLLCQSIVLFSGLIKG